MNNAKCMDSFPLNTSHSCFIWVVYKLIRFYIKTVGFRYCLFFSKEISVKRSGSQKKKKEIENQMKFLIISAITREPLFSCIN